jgi:hypothetical protein
MSYHQQAKHYGDSNTTYSQAPPLPRGEQVNATAKVEHFRFTFGN